MRRIIVSTLAALTAATALSAAAATSVPFHGTDSGTFAALPPDADNVVFAQASTIGQATHLGRYSLVAHEYTDLDDLRIFGGAFTLTAANGDSSARTRHSRPGTVSRDRVRRPRPDPRRHRPLRPERPDA